MYVIGITILIKAKGHFVMAASENKTVILVNGFKPLIVFGKGAVWDFLGVYEYDFGLTNNFLFYYLACPIIICLQIAFGRSLCCVETSQLI